MPKRRPDKPESGGYSEAKGATQPTFFGDLAMIEIEVSMWGEQIADAICSDDEEMAEMLKGLAERKVAQFADVVSYLSADECGPIVAFLRGLADIIEASV